MQVQISRLLLAILHLPLVALANYLAFWLRFDGRIPEDAAALMAQTMPALVVIRGLMFLPMRLYQGMWRYTSVRDLLGIIGGVGISSILFFALVRFGLGRSAYPSSVFLIDALLLIGLMSGLRMAYRLSREVRSRSGDKRVLIYGAGDAGEMIARDMRQNAASGYSPIGFIDDDRRKVGQRIHGAFVLGTRNELDAIIRRYAPAEVLVAIPSAAPATIRSLLRLLQPYKLPIKTLPSLLLLEDSVHVSQIRNLSVEDLLSRAPVGLDPEPLRRLIAGRRILVTGAAGSIGSELCRQLASLGPERLVLFDHSENGLYQLINELAAKGFGSVIEPRIGDICDRERVRVVWTAERPQIVFHAAAHKHVPLMEISPGPAVRNNVTGTRTIAEASQEAGVERFVFISTDKAVNPVSVMGATKRAAELLIQTMARDSATLFFTVRFGNVLGSNGSVVPLFLDQIKAGGPVTVTHPEMRRYFMIIPETVHLVLHAASIGAQGGTYVLEMGDQIKVLDMARHLIRLAGFVPDEEIAVEFSGVRPGEKLFEELVGGDEKSGSTAVDDILEVAPRVPQEPARLLPALARLEKAAAGGRDEDVIAALRAVVDSFEPSPLWADRHTAPTGRISDRRSPTV